MSSSSLLWVGLGNLCLNLVSIWLLSRRHVKRRQAAYHELCREAREICQHVERIKREDGYKQFSATFTDTVPFDSAQGTVSAIAP